jgi:hypothetical protein
MADPTQFIGYDSDSDSAYLVHHHNNPPFKTRAATADASQYLEYDRDIAYPVHHQNKPPFKIRTATADASQFLEYDSNSDNLGHHHKKPPFTTSENNWLLKYQQLFQFYLTYRHCEVPIKAEMPTLADWVLYQRAKFKSDPDNYDSHRLHLLKGIKFSFVKEDKNKANFVTNLEAYIHFNDCRNTISIPKDHDLHGWW